MSSSQHLNEQPVMQPVMQPVIKVQQVKKCYKTYRKPIHRLWQSFFPKKTYAHNFWALKGIDLTVHKGETVGIVGKNGSGKSTLLQIIAGILQPTEGQFETHGRISALLELGAGFNPEFTGMENARLNASIMGLTRDEFHQKLPDIVDFCGLGDFLHRPVKTYSSGMFVRLAFAVAINMNPDILIVDEALAVGDVRFQRKCFRRLDALKEQGVSILFVTHSTDSVLKYCDRAIMLDEGELKMTGSPKDVVQAYLEMMFESDADVQAPVAINAEDYAVDFDPTVDNCVKQPTYNANEHRWGDGRAKICHYEVLQNGAYTSGLVKRGDRLTIRMSVLFEQDIDELIYGITVKTEDGNAVYGTNSRLVSDMPLSQKGGDLVPIEFELTLSLLSGHYFISLGVAQDHEAKDNIAVDRRYDMIHIHVGTTPEAFGYADLAGKIEMIDEVHS
ncbi:ABC transporter ATP-binding protein [Arenicella xantha]|uniref:Lipopolysaccharide transport system ATP-binding protein n=1 Tax=Arenicella xantha TaxID=644221 RepID=A0A395JFC8_9GAMM|nr:ABC transporter ATP-binding protein [Arenicella xantha]RBP48449.1 lipopolysaccharide transport system ATP-binding protein [Arenicella xantha]